MNVMRSLQVAAAVGTCLLPLTAVAQSLNQAAQPILAETPQVGSPAGPSAAPYTAEIDLGMGWQSQTSARYGRYNGMPDQGLSALGGFEVKGGDAWNSGGTTYYDIGADLMGWNGRSAHIKFGQQGTWGVTFTYDDIPYTYSTTFHSVWDTGGNLIPGVAAGSIKNVTTQLTGKLPELTIGTTRDIYVGNVKYQVGDWLIQGGVRHDHKEGTQENSAAWLAAPSFIAANGNLSASAVSYFAQPVNYDQDRYDISATYVHERLQAMLGYTYSQFTDNTLEWMGANPFDFTAAGAGGNPANIHATYSLPPSNSAHQFKAQVGYNLTPTTRLNANAQFGLMEQNSPYINPEGNGNAPSVAAEPRSSFDGMIQTFFGNLAISSMPLPKLDVRASYTIDDRNNLSPQNAYPFYDLDTATRNTSECNGTQPVATGYCVNLPYSYLNQKAQLEAGYRILNGTRLSLGYTFDATHRTFSNANDSTTSTIDAKVRSHIFDDLDASIGYEHADRWAQDYIGGNQVFGAMNLTEKDVYGFYDYFLASRRRDEIKFSTDYAPLPGFNATITAKADYDFYPQSATGLGLKSNNNYSIGPDIDYQVNPRLNLHAFYTYQLIYFDQSSLVTNAGCNGNGTSLTPGAGCNGNGAWTGKNNNATHTVGFGADWQAMDALKLSVDYTFDSGNISYSLADGGIYAFPSGGASGTSSLLLTQLPPITSTLNSITLKAEYKLMQNVSLLGIYAFENFSYKDFGLNVGATQVSNALLPGDANPNYNVHTVMAMLRARW
jgi:MtrB/PioB family decaheme-associated outer membrane protein